MSQNIQTPFKNPFQKLNKFVQNLRREDIQSVDALLIELTGDNNAGHMLTKLMYWWDKKSWNWVYKSCKDWFAELRLTEKQVYRIHKLAILEAIGVERDRKIVHRTSGNPNHYRLDSEKFLQHLAEFAGETVETILGWMGMAAEEREEALPTSGQKRNQPEVSSAPDLKEDPLTRNTLNKQELPEDKEQLLQTEPTQPPVVVVPHLSSYKEKELIDQYGLERVQEMVDYAKTQKTRNITGFILRGLRENWVIPQKKEDVPAKSGEYKNPFEGMKWADFAD